MEPNNCKSPGPGGRLAAETECSRRQHPQVRKILSFVYLFCSDTVLVENLEHTKKTALDIEEKVTESKKTSIEIDKVRMKGRHN